MGAARFGRRNGREDRRCLTLSNVISADVSVAPTFSLVPSDGVPTTTVIPGTVVVFCSFLFIVALQGDRQGLLQLPIVAPLEIHYQQKVGTDTRLDVEKPNSEWHTLFP